MEWQPIETAPRNGEEVLITNTGPGTIVRVGSFRYGAWKTIHFTTDDEGEISSRLGGMRPSHWMPLPQPPRDK